MTERPAGAIVVHGTEVLPTDSPRSRLEKLARITLDSMVQFVGLLDAQGTVLEINKVALDAVGIQLADVEGKPFWTTFWWQVSPEINETLRACIARAAQGEFVRWDTNIYGRAGGKETIVIDASLCPVKDDDGNVVFICAEGRDITEKKAQEREIAQKNIELQGLLERIRELDEIKTQFFANVSHELRTPLALILGPAQRLIDDAGAMTAPERREGAQVIARSARMLLKHVNDLLDMSRLEAGKLKIDLQPTDVAAMVRFLASHFAVLAAERAVDFVVDADTPSVAAVDPDKLQRVLMNLLANAFKFVPAGGHVRCTLEALPDAWVIAVEDDGPGVKPALRSAVFERFRQGDGGSSRKRGGTGLGLAIAKEFVEMHKGHIEVLDSALGGARFQITLPRDPSTLNATADLAAADISGNRATLEGLIEELRPPSSAQGEEPHTELPIVGRPRVLVVEDNPDMNRFVVQCLSRDYEVVAAFDGREGLEKALRFRPTLVVSDVMMPNMSGPEMIAEMRKLPELREMPVVLLSAKADEQLRVTLLDEGARDFVVKPFSERELLVRVRNLVVALQAREQIEGLRSAAEAANRTKDEFLAMLGHELRNPLSPIVGALYLLKLPGSEHTARAHAIIERQVNHLTRLVDDLLDVARIARGKVELRIETIEMADVVTKAIEQALPLIEQRQHALAVDVPRHGLAVEGDAIRLIQVVANLLTNAAKYTPPKGKIAVWAERAVTEIVLHVRDTGVGISPEILPQVFELFVQDRQGIDRSQGGLGLGLAIVRNLVERHGGAVTAKSAGAGLGSEFTVRLPSAAVTAPRESTRPPAQPREENKPGARILVVDDNEDGADMLSAMLVYQGYNVRVANSGHDALALSTEFQPQVALLDLGLPAMDGYELAGRLRAMTGLASVRLIAVTGYGQETDRQRTTQAGFDHHLVKPVSVETVQSVVKALVESLDKPKG